MLPRKRVLFGFLALILFVQFYGSSTLGIISNNTVIYSKAQENTEIINSDTISTDGLKINGSMYLFPTKGYVENIYYAAPYIFILDSNEGLLIYDFRTTKYPKLIGFYTNTGNLTNFVISETFAFLSNESGIIIVDLSDLTKPKQAGFYEIKNEIINNMIISQNWLIVSFKSGDWSIYSFDYTFSFNLIYFKENNYYDNNENNENSKNNYNFNQMIKYNEPFLFVQTSNTSLEIYDLTCMSKIKLYRTIFFPGNITSFQTYDGKLIVSIITNNGIENYYFSSINFLPVLNNKMLNGVNDTEINTYNITYNNIDNENNETDQTNIDSTTYGEIPTTIYISKENSSNYANTIEGEKSRIIDMREFADYVYSLNEKEDGNTEILIFKIKDLFGLNNDIMYHYIEQNLIYKYILEFPASNLHLNNPFLFITYKGHDFSFISISARIMPITISSIETYNFTAADLSLFLTLNLNGSFEVNDTTLNSSDTTIGNNVFQNETQLLRISKNNTLASLIENLTQKYNCSFKFLTNKENILFYSTNNSRIATIKIEQLNPITISNISFIELPNSSNILSAKLFNRMLGVSTNNSKFFLIDLNDLDNPKIKLNISAHQTIQTFLLNSFGLYLSIKNTGLVLISNEELKRAEINGGTINITEELNESTILSFNSSNSIITPINSTLDIRPITNIEFSYLFSSFQGLIGISINNRNIRILKLNSSGELVITTSRIDFTEDITAIAISNDIMLIGLSNEYLVYISIIDNTKLQTTGTIYIGDYINSIQIKDDKAYVLGNEGILLTIKLMQTGSDDYDDDGLSFLEEQWDLQSNPNRYDILTFVSPWPILLILTVLSLIFYISGLALYKYYRIPLEKLKKKNSSALS